MKTQPTKKVLFCFIALMLSATPAIVHAQKRCKHGSCPAGYICIDGYCHRYPAPRLSSRGIDLVKGHPSNKKISAPANSKATGFQFDETKSHLRKFMTKQED